MSTTLETPISSIESNRRRVGALKSLGVVSVGDALTYYPFRVTDPVPARSLHEAKIGEKMAFAAHVLETRVFPHGTSRLPPDRNSHGRRFAARRNTPKSLASLVFFSYRKSYVDWVQRKLHAGALLVVAGEPSVYDNRLQFTHPDLLTINPVQSQSENGGMERRFRRSCESASRQSEIRCANDRRSAETSLPSTTGISCNFANFQRTYS